MHKFGFCLKWLFFWMPKAVKKWFHCGLIGALACSVILIYPTNTSAQIETREQRRDIDTQPSADSLLQRPTSEERDSQFVNYFVFDKPFDRHILLDDEFRDRFLHFNPAKSGGWEQATTGHLGSPTSPLILEADREIGFRPGIEDYQLYWKKIEDQRYYQQERAYSDLMYTQGAVQDENTTRVLFSTGFDDGVNFSLEYNRINHIGNYDRQRNFHTFINSSVSHHSEDGKWHNFATFISNSVLAFENGGITSDTLFEGEFFEDDRSLIDVNLENAESRQRQLAIYFSNYYRFGRASLFGLDLPFYLNHYMSFGNRFFKFSDSNPDPAYYGGFYQVDRGFRRFLEVGTMEQRVGVLIGRAFDFSEDSYENYLAVNLLWTSHNLRFDPLDSRIRQWFLIADAGISPGDFLQIEGHGKLGLGDDGGDALLDVNAEIQFGDQLSVLGMGYFQRRSPSAMQNNFPSPEGFVYNHDHPKFTHSYLGGGIQLSSLNLEASFRQHLLFNLPYFNEEGVSGYLSSTLAIPQILVEFKPDLGNLILQTNVAWQQQSRSELAMPSFYLKQRLAASGRLFDKALDFQIGTDAVFFTGYDSKTYFPVIGRFKLAGRNLEDTFRANPFAALKIQTFEVILRFENFGFPFTNRIDYHFDGYPLPDLQWRLTLRWQLND